MSAARTRRRARDIAALAIVVLVGAGCGGGGPRPPSDTRAGTPRPGGKLTVHTAFEPFSLDPANAIGPEALVLYNAHRPLFRRDHRRPDGLSPDLAAAPPEIGDGGRTLTVRIRRGVRFAPPVRREVTAADVRYAIQRSLTPRVASPPAGAYMADVTSIDVPDSHTLVFRLARPYARAVAGALVRMSFSAPVPEEYARRFDRGKRSRYGEHAVATGPYMVEADREGRVTGYEPGRYLRLVRNPSWNREADFRPAYVDRVEMRLGSVEPHLRSQRVLNGKGAISLDPPSRVSLKQTLGGPRRRASGRGAARPRRDRIRSTEHPRAHRSTTSTCAGRWSRCSIGSWPCSTPVARPLRSSPRTSCRPRSPAFAGGRRDPRAGLRLPAQPGRRPRCGNRLHEASGISEWALHGQRGATRGRRD